MLPALASRPWRARLALAVALTAALALPTGILRAQRGDSTRAHASARPPVDPGTDAGRTSIVATIVPLFLGAVMHGGHLSTEGRTTATMVMAGGLVVGPAFGYLQAGLDRQAGIGMVVRSAGVTLMAIPMRYVLCESRCPSPVLLLGSFSLGTGLVIGSTVHDLVRVREDVRAVARDRRREALRIAPSYDVTSGAAGVRASLTFR